MSGSLNLIANQVGYQMLISRLVMLNLYRCTKDGCRD